MPASPAEPLAPIDVVVKGRRTQHGLDRTARAVTVVDLSRAKKESADLGTVLSRVEGISVQRTGSLGSAARFSLGGFDETQVRFFIDGIPLEYAGYSFGLANVPLNFAQKVEVYKGVVPVNFGADALGGAFNLVTDRNTRGTRAWGSYQAGSFGVQRLAAGARHLDGRSGLFVKAEGFFDHADNDYPILVDVADRSGLITETKVHRFHDAYTAGGANVEVGLVDRPWARRFLLRAFVTDYRKDIQHNSIMTVPYGEAEEGGLSSGATLRYEKSFDAGVLVSAVGGYLFERGDFLDATECIYDWLGQCSNPQRVPGEVGTAPSDSTVWDHSGFLRANANWSLHPEHRLKLASAPTYLMRTGDNRLDEVSDPLNDHRDLFKWINGLEYEATLLSGALSNMAFVKNYVQVAHAAEIMGVATIERDAERVLWGAGDGLRYDLFDWLFAKGSYEYAARLPEARELFGDGRFVAENLELEAERSHNANLSLAVDGLASKLGTFGGQITGFLRDAEHMIVLLAVDQMFRYENVYDATAWGVEGAVVWLSPGEYVEVGGNVTYQDLRNVSAEGQLAQFEGDRIPQRPYFWANGHVRLKGQALVVPRDELSLTWYLRCVHGFLRTWESYGNKGPEDVIPDQLTQTLALTYGVHASEARNLAFSVEVDNITDELVYDFFGVQRPGRAFYAKFTLAY